MLLLPLLLHNDQTHTKNNNTNVIATSSTAIPLQYLSRPTYQVVIPIAKRSSEEIIRDTFKDIPALIEVARCESQFRQSNQDGSILRGTLNDRDIGAMQINEFYHLENAKKLGIDIYTLKGNLEYARYLYNKNGLRDWSASATCWLIR